MKNTIIFLLFSFFGLASTGQSIDAGKNYFYYQRYTSAASEFERLVAAKPDNEEATYWLGQTFLRQNDSVKAENLYKTALSKNNNAALLHAGVGQTILMQNQTDSARKHFEAALAISQDPQVFHAVARANVEAQRGDANYAIQTLQAIPKRKRKEQKNAETFLLMGQAYRKLIDGGNAVTAFNQALSMDPKLAEAKYQIGKVYLTQNNAEIFLPAFEEAVQIDPKYAPAFYELFFYWFERDINKARAYFNNYLAVSDVDASTQYDQVSIIYASRDYKSAIDSAKTKITQLGNAADPRYYKLIAYSYDELKDSIQAKDYLEQYFTKQKPQSFLPQDYVFRAKLLGKFPGNGEAINASFATALALDTSKAGQQKIMRDAAAAAALSGNFSNQANWLGQLYRADTASSNRALYDWGYAHYKAGNFVNADSIFCGVYKQKYPDEIFGYLWCARAAGAQDTTMEKGIAVEPYKNLIAFARASGEREDYKATLIQAHGYLASYYANVSKDKDSAVVYLQNILKLDPENASAIRYIEILTKPEPKTAPAKSNSKTRNSSTKNSSARNPEE